MELSSVSDPDSDWIRIGIQLKMLDTDPYQINTDPKHWNEYRMPVLYPRSQASGE